MECQDNERTLVLAVFTGLHLSVIHGGRLTLLQLPVVLGDIWACRVQGAIRKLRADQAADLAPLLPVLRF